jgi:predicted acetyltransferase
MWIGFGRAGITPEQVELRRPGFTFDRSLACFEGDDVVGTARSFPTRLTVPGGSVDAGAVTNVTVLPTHTRRGLLTDMMRRQLDDIAAWGEPVAILIASEAPIYGRFGYGSATTNAEVALDPSKCAFRDAPAESAGVRLVRKEVARRLLPAIYERFHAAQPGAIGRADLVWDAILGIVGGYRGEDTRERFHLVHPDGYARYVIDEKWERRLPKSVLHLEELVAVTPDAYAALWRQILSVDLIASVRAGDRPLREPLPWLLDDPAQVQTTSTSHFLWVRLLDVPSALASRSYAAPGELVLEVVDPFRPQSGGRFALEVDPGDPPTCHETTAAPDLTVPADVLAASYLGDPVFIDAALAGRAVEHTPDAAARADAMFGWTPRPWCHTWF